MAGTMIKGSNFQKILREDLANAFDLAWNTTSKEAWWRITFKRLKGVKYGR